MGRELTPDELRELLAPYALDAVDAEERAQVEAWLAHHPRARSEVAELRETVAYLARVDREAPPTLWRRIEEALAAEPPPLVMPTVARTTTPARPRVPRAANGRRSGWARAALVVATGALAVAGSVAFLVTREMDDQEARLDRLAAHLSDDALLRAAQAAAADDHAQVVMLSSADGDRRAKVVSMPDGSGYLMEHNLPALPAGQTYQLWALTGDPTRPEMISVGVLGRRPSVTPFRAVGAVVGYAVTEESVPGAVRASGSLVVEGMMGP